jgi:hypothetical protein
MEKRLRLGGRCRYRDSGEVNEEKRIDGPQQGTGLRARRKVALGPVEAGANSRTYEARPLASSRRRVAISRDVRCTPWRS